MLLSRRRDMRFLMLMEILVIFWSLLLTAGRNCKASCWINIAVEPVGFSAPLIVSFPNANRHHCEGGFGPGCDFQTPLLLLRPRGTLPQLASAASSASSFPQSRARGRGRVRQGRHLGPGAGDLSWLGYLSLRLGCPSCLPLTDGDGTGCQS